MPADIRNFFGGKGSQPTAKAPAKKEEPKKPRARASKKTTVIEDSDDDVVITKATPKKATPKKAVKAESPKAVATSASDYYGSSNKPKRSESVKTKAPTKKESPVVFTPKDTTPVQPAPKPTLNGKSTPIRTKKPVTARSKPKKGDDDFVDVDTDDDIFGEEYAAKGKGPRGDDYDEGSDSDVDMKELKDESEDDVKLVKSKKTTAASKKRKSPVLEEDDEDEEDEPPKKARRKAPTAPKATAPAKKKAKKEDVPENAAIQDIFDSIPTVRAPTPPPRDGEKKFNYASHAAKQAGTNVGTSSGDRPTGAPNCLAGLSFVFTGILQTLQREEGQALVKQYGGKIMTSASKKTSFVVLGSDAGPKKLEVIKQNNLKTIDEQGLYELIRRLPANGGDGKAAAEYEAKQQKEQEKIANAAAEIDAEEKRKAAEEKKMAAKAAQAAAKAGAQAPVSRSITKPDPSNQLWTVKYAPTSLNQICGNKGQVEKLQNWLRSFQKNQQKNFKMAGKDGSGVFRAVIISGPPGIGKTTAAHLVAKIEGYDIVENNASDTRSKKMVEASMQGVLSTTSLMGYFGEGHKKVEASKKKLVLIMDEVDGMSGGDRGGVGALAALCKKAEIPIILICNDRKLPKMKPFDYCTFDLPFRRPTTDMIRARISTIAFREQLKLSPPVVNALIEGTGADIRQVVNMLSQAKLDQPDMDYDAGKSMSKAWEKHIILKPWDIAGKILGGGMFASSSKSTLNDKVELYFNDHEFSPLMLQENYLGTNPMLAANEQGKEKNLKVLELVEKASASISDGDLVDRMIHGSQPQWSLMPTHAIFAFVRPASFVSGSMVGHQTRFTQWLGQNSKQGKLVRMVKEIQGHMRLRSSGDRHEIRQQYVPMLWNSLNKKLSVEGKEAAPDVISLMDSYYLTKDDYDAIAELGVGYMDQENLKTDSQAKATFTRLYNSMSHPLPFMKASSVVAPKKVAKDRPDLEEAIEESDDGEEDVKEVVEEEEGDMSKDKYIKAPKKKKAAAPQKSTAGKKGAKRARDDDDDEESDGSPKGKKVAKGKGKEKAKK
ncbi:DNA replication factor C, large subunit [Tothia fuscella]|uniref:Replication factor C subunit 1 n=1 Tax=Tothia fuscella TaxID=1048955 RepID=A0A9P4NUQ7_9PEZI|nr:DNA replication factor C, large subunit [Tothia fuscella]